MYLSEEALYVFSPRSPHQPPKTDEAKRDTFISQIEAYKNQGRPIVYADESGFAKDMPAPMRIAREESGAMAPIIGKSVAVLTPLAQSLRGPF